MTTTNPDGLKAASEKAMQAQEAIKGTLAEHGKKLDAIDLDSLKKMKEDVLNGLDILQKSKLAVEAETKARDDQHKALETQLADIKVAGGDITKEMTEIKGAIERLSLRGGEDEVKALEKLNKKAFREFTKSNNPNAMYFADFLGGAAEFKDLSVGSQPDGGYMVMPLIGPMITTRIFETSPIRSIASTMEISTDAIEFPTDNDQAASGGWAGETQSRPNTP